MRAELLPIPGLREADLDHWRELAAAAGAPNPFFEPELVLPAARALAAEPALLVAKDGAAGWAGAMPVVRERGWRHMPIRGYASWRHLYSFFGGPLIRSGAEGAALRCWLGASGERNLLRPFLALDLLDAEGPLREALEQVASEVGARTVVFEQHQRAALRSGPEGLDLGVSAKRRSEGKRLQRRLAEALGGEVELLDRSEDPAAIEEFLHLEASGWKGQLGTALASDRRHAEFFREACDGFRRLGRLQLLSHSAGGRPVAMKCNLLAGETVFCFKTAFDQSLAQYSPGTQLEREMVGLIAGGDRQITLIDTCTEGENEAANRIWPDRRDLASLVVVAPGPRGAPARVLLGGLTRARQAARQRR